MRVIPAQATQNTINIYRMLNRMSKQDIIHMNITNFALNFDNVTYQTVYHAVRTYRALNMLF